MITVSNLSLQFGGVPLFKLVDLKFLPGNCYGVIGANGAGKSTFIKVLTGEIDNYTGEVIVPKDVRISSLEQNQYKFDDYSIVDTVIMGNERLYAIKTQKDALYEKPDFSDEDGILAAELEGEFAEMNGWEAESEISMLLNGLGLRNLDTAELMSTLSAKDKIKVLLARALFGSPNVIILDEPTNHLDIGAINWLEDFLMDYEGTVIVVSHDRHFLNNVCTHIVDIDFNKIKMYVGNYDFWYDSSNMMQSLLRDQNKKAEEKAKELQAFITRFSANKSKSRQASSRRKILENMSLDDMPASSRRYPFVGFKADREVGKDILSFKDVSKTADGKVILNNVSFTVGKNDKIAIISDDDIAVTEFIKLISLDTEPDSGIVKWGVSASCSYFPKDNAEFFDGSPLSLLDWLSQYTPENDLAYLRGFLGRMLFSGDDVLKPVKVLSGGEKVRCMLSRMMLSGSNVLVLDQPTNHLDLESITAVNNGLIDFKGNVIFTSHDHQFIQTIANRIIELHPDGSITDKPCTFDEYIEYKDC
ncbi:MAG: ABC-F family ATP-binding cassette domain-containing protein [Clostridia bacterium]